MKKYIWIAVAALITIGVIVIAIVAHAPKVNCNDPGFAQYISAYTEGAISKNASIKVVLNSMLADSIDHDKDISKYIKVYPKTPGKAKFLDERTIEFAPDKGLVSGKEYVVMLRLGRIAKVPREYRKFVFPISVIKQDLRVTIEDQVTIDKETLKYQQITGNIKTADIENIDNVKQSLKVLLGKRQVPVKWRETELGDIFNFQIDSVERIEKAQTLEVKYDGFAIGSSTKGVKKITIPPINEFDVTSIKVVESPSQHIRIQFTDPVKDNQNMSGLISVADESQMAEEYKTEIDDNCINLYPPVRKNGNAKVYISAGIQNVLGYKLDEDKVFSIDYEMQKPQIRSVKTGLILPDGENGLVYPFEAVNLTAVDVTIIKVLEKNILSYIRDFSEYWNSSNLQQTGVPVFRKTIHINDRESEDVTSWKRYYLELSELIDAEPGSIYNIKIAFRKSHTVFDCDTCAGGDDVSDEKDLDIKDFDNLTGYYESLDNNYYESAGYNWRNANNPCYKMYYQSDKFLSQNILASNLGVIAKKGSDNSLCVFVTDLKTSSPVPNAQVELYGYQQQLLGSKPVDHDGKADFGQQPKGFFVVAKRDKECNYLKIQDGNSLSMSKFNISGAEVQDGMKGYIYGERGVWRPGDSIHLSFILKENTKKPLPANFPITVEVRNPLQQQIYKETVGKNESNFYVFNLKTDDKAVTGNYEATISCGNARFYKNLRIENVLPNRLKINMSFNKDVFGPNGNIVNISSAWLHGATARNLKTTVEMMVSEAPLSFDKWKGYSFNDEKNSSSTYNDWEEVYSGNLSDAGKTSFSQKFEASQYSKFPPKIKAHFRTRVYEKGGRFSKDDASIEVLPYSNYVGIKMPETDGHFLEVDKEQKVQLVVTDNKGNAVSESRKLRVKLLKLDWQWWYDGSNYVSEYNSNLLSDDEIIIKGSGQYTFLVKYPSWGRFLIDVTDIKTGISASKIFYMDWPSSFGRSPIMSQGSTIVELSSDKTKYQVGDLAKITIPSSEGHALISIENGTRVIQNQWISTKEGKTEYKLKIEPDMEPGVYVFVTLLQPHSQTVNDMPIRMYGVLPLDVENPETKLEPVISMPDVINADDDVKITVSEKSNKAMTYTIALVDDGLLDLTHYKTPDPWKAFYSREALGVKTIDMYDNVIGAFGGKIERMFSVGGDDEYTSSNAQRANNFESVVAFLGPFTTNGSKKHHTIKMPKYIGSVRTMVIAGNGKAYGKAEKTCAVTKPLMIFATTPRIIATNEKFKLPVTVFTGDDKIRDVTVKVKASDGLSISGESSKVLTFSGKGEQDPSFEITTGDKRGIGKIEIQAISGNNISDMELKIEIRQPNTSQQQVISRVVEPGQTVEIPVTPIGRQNTNTATISINGMLPINYDGHIGNLMANPYESLEQTVSKAFPMVYAPVITEIKGQAKEMGENMIRESIKKIYNYQTAGGGLSYWRNENYSDVWLTSYAGHFMLEAQKAGYNIKNDFIEKWKKYQRLKAESWTPDSYDSYSQQAYRLYTLALAGDAQNGQMNRLKEQPKITNEAKIYLAAAYTLSGKKTIGENLINPLDKTVSANSPFKLLAFCELGKKDRAFEVAQAITEQLNSEYYWMDCEYECMSLVALGKYFEKFRPASRIDCKYSLNGGKQENINTERIFASKTLMFSGLDKQSISFTNNSAGNLYVEITNKGIPEAGNEKAENSTISAEIHFYQGRTEISPKNLKQGEDFTAVIKVKNPSDQNLNKVGITEIFPSGWEIITGSTADSYDDGDNYSYSYGRNSGYIKYTDVRDDRKLTYFYLPSHGEMEFRTNLTATYAGTYYLPGLVCQDLENPKIFAKTKGMTVVVEEE